MADAAFVVTLVFVGVGLPALLALVCGFLLPWNSARSWMWAIGQAVVTSSTPIIWYGHAGPIPIILLLPLLIVAHNWPDAYLCSAWLLLQFLISLTIIRFAQQRREHTLAPASRKGAAP